MVCLGIAIFLRLFYIESSSNLDVFWPVQILDALGDAECLILFLRRTLVRELNGAIIRGLPSELSGHFFHGFPVELDVTHEGNALLHSELAQHFADNLLLEDVQFHQVATVGAERAEKVQDAELTVQGLHHAWELEFVLDEIDVPNVPATSDAAVVHTHPPGSV